MLMVAAVLAVCAPWPLAAAALRRQLAAGARRHPRSGDAHASPRAHDAGTHASAPAPPSRSAYMKWGTDYAGRRGVKLNYQAIGSGGGIAAIEAKTVDFGASDAPLEQADLQTQRPRRSSPWSSAASCSSSISAASPTGQLKLDGPTPRRASSWARSRRGTTRPSPALNPGVKLPADQDQRRPSLRRLGHVLDLHALPHGGLADLEGRSAPTRTSAWPVGIGGKGKPASPPSCSSSAARSATSSTPTPSRTA